MTSVYILRWFIRSIVLSYSFILGIFKSVEQGICEDLKSERSVRIKILTLAYSKVDQL